MLVLNTVLSGGMGRLFSTFRESQEKALCYSVSSNFAPMPQDGNFYLYIGTQPDNIRRVTRMLQEEMEKLMNQPVSADEMKRAKLKLKSAILSNQQSTTGIANYLGSHRALDLDSNEDLLPKIDQVTPEQIMAVAQKYFSKPSVTTVVAPKAALEKADLPSNGELNAAY
jgi:zinc protease